VPRPAEQGGTLVARSLPGPRVRLLSCGTCVLAAGLGPELGGACLCVYSGHVFPVWDVAAGPTGHWFASAGADRAVRLWVTDRTVPLRVLAGHSADVDCVR
jgi:WD40 repeat protein